MSAALLKTESVEGDFQWIERNFSDKISYPGGCFCMILNNWYAKFFDGSHSVDDSMIPTCFTAKSLTLSESEQKCYEWTLRSWEVIFYQ